MSKSIILTTILAFWGFTTALNAQEEEQAVSAVSAYNEGLQEIKAKNYAEGLALMGQALAAVDSSSETDLQVLDLAKKNGAIAAYYVGNEQRKSNEFEAALATYQQGIAYSADFYANYIGQAQALEKLDRNAEAVAAYLSAGKACQNANKEDQAEKMMSKAENMVAVAWGNKEWAEVEAMVASFVENQASADVHYYMSDALKAKGEHKVAMKYIEQSIGMADAGERDKYLMQKAEILEAQGETAAAVEVYGQIKDGKYVERAKYKVGELSN